MAPNRSEEVEIRMDVTPPGWVIMVAEPSSATVPVLYTMTDDLIKLLPYEIISAKSENWFKRKKKLPH